MIPKDKPCIYCKKRIMFVPTERGVIPVEAGWTPFKKVDGQNLQALYTNDGFKIPCVILPEERADEAEGFAHIAHLCAKKPMPHRRQPLNRRSMLREAGLID